MKLQFSNGETCVLEKMVGAYWGVDLFNNPEARRRMQAAAEVLADKLLGPVTDEEWAYCADEMLINTCFHGSEKKSYLSRPALNRLIAARRTLIAPEPTLRDKVLALLQTNTVTTDALATQIVTLLETK